ncbi:MAG TPA: nuclear transport factor 2 family protein [Cryomorphaceae bacterium]|nr:nuclear transport factor 2 family protein [Cryomorphaceae bacterium]
MNQQNPKMNSSAHKKLITDFYKAFIRLDGESMAACYHEKIVFEDPAFGTLKEERAGNMWRMLCQSQKGKDFIITFSDVSTDDEKGSAHWEAKYTFSKTGRKVHNKINAHFEFADGKIVKHRDDFDLKKWAKQAMGFKGTLLGGTAFFKKKLQEQTNGMLDKFEKNLRHLSA